MIIRKVDAGYNVPSRLEKMKNHMQSVCCWRICHICLQIRGRRRKHKIYGEILQTAAIIHQNSQIANEEEGMSGLMTNEGTKYKTEIYFSN